MRSNSNLTLLDSTPQGIRTLTGAGLSRFPLPVGIEGHEAVLRERPNSVRPLDY